MLVTQPQGTLHQGFSELISGTYWDSGIDSSNHQGLSLLISGTYLDTGIVQSNHIHY